MLYTKKTTYFNHLPFLLVYCIQLPSITFTMRPSHYFPDTIAAQFTGPSMHNYYGSDIEYLHGTLKQKISYAIQTGFFSFITQVVGLALKKCARQVIPQLYKEKADIELQQLLHKKTQLELAITYIKKQALEKQVLHDSSKLIADHQKQLAHANAQMPEEIRKKLAAESISMLEMQSKKIADFLRKNQNAT